MAARRDRSAAFRPPSFRFGATISRVLLRTFSSAPRAPAPRPRVARDRCRAAAIATLASVDYAPFVAAATRQLRPAASVASTTQRDARSSRVSLLLLLLFSRRTRREDAASRAGRRVTRRNVSSSRESYPRRASRAAAVALRQGRLQEAPTSQSPQREREHLSRAPSVRLRAAARRPRQIH